MRPPRVKVCGITQSDALAACAAAGVDWVGFNFYPPSPRSLDLDRAVRLRDQLPAGLESVGLFVDRSPREVAEVATRVGLHYLQLHGDEPVEDLAALTAWPVVRAFRLRDRASVDRMVAFLDRAERLGCPPFAILLDAHIAGKLGGTGQSIPADLLDDLPIHPRVILAGGLRPENVAERVEQVRPWMVDVASGVERSPGQQDPERVRAFVAAARGSRAPAVP